ncbi:hypothetical protein [Haloglomus litoreum]|uniref:hypothetical protein n=1 Tax=Haloglomus litoreum TaxID=3034026 RepID=UPI0023E7A890|nr:hypothetical protein [Haloglomus sp. DT116]
MTGTTVSATGTDGDGTDWLADRRLDWLVTACVCWGTAGLVLDVRSHVEGFSFAEEGFLTPEHTVIYSGFLAVAGLLAVVIQRERWRGADWLDAVPTGYGLGLVGLVLFALAGPGDALWHATFGAEADVEALASPTHLALATGGVLFCTSPLRATLARARSGEPTEGWVAQGPLVVTATLAAVVATVFTVYAHPAFLLAGSGGVGAAHGLSGLLFHAGLVAAVVLFLSTRVRLAPGVVALLVVVPAAAGAWLGAHPWLVPWYVGAGLLAESGVWLARWTLDAGRWPPVVGAVPPAALVAGHFASLAARGGLSWTVHLWVGAVFMAAVVGGFLGLLSAPRPMLRGGETRQAAD